MRRSDFSWSGPGILDRYKRMTEDGKSAEVIAQAIGTTRNSVIGRWHRDGIRRGLATGPRTKPSLSPGERRERAAAKRRLIPRAAPALRKEEKPEAPVVVFEPPAGKIGHVRILDLEPFHCRWPMGDPRDRENFCYCGEVRSGWGPGSIMETANPYCLSHHRLGHQPVQKNLTHQRPRRI